MEGEIVKYESGDGFILHGFLTRSKKENDSVIINVFGMTGDFFGSDRYPAFASTLKNTGVDFFSSNNRGLGSSFEFDNKDGTSKYIGTAKENFEECMFDIGGAIKAMKKMGYANIILQGHSTGCQKIAYYQYKKQDKSVKGLILLALADDYNLAKKALGKKFEKAVLYSRNMVKKGRGEEFAPTWFTYYNYRRFLSYADSKNVEARLFDYDSKMLEFSSIKCPVLAIFGSDEEHRAKPIKKYMEILSKRTGSKMFDWIIVKGADHSFHGKEAELATVVKNWAEAVLKK